MLKKGDEKDLRWWGLSKKCSQPKELPQPEGEQFEQQDKVILDYKLCWSWNSNTLANWCGELTRLKRPWCWERLKVQEEGDDRGWDGCMALPTGWTWVWLSSGSWWWTGKPGVLQSMGSQRVPHDWVTELNLGLTCHWYYQLPGEGSGNPLQYSCLGNPMDRAWWAIVHGVAKSQTWLSNTTSCLVLTEKTLVIY